MLGFGIAYLTCLALFLEVVYRAPPAHEPCIRVLPTSALGEDGGNGADKDGEVAREAPLGGVV